ncbi:MAG: FliH/SctL family protein [Halanaerobacter sp.]
MSNVIKSNQVKSGEKVKLDNSNFKLADEAEKESELKEEKDKIISQAQEEAEEIIAKAKKEAQEIKEEARQEIEREREEVFNQAKEDGYQEGLKEGQKEGRAEGKEEIKNQCRDLLGGLEEAVTDFQQSMELREEDMKADLVELAIVISEKIVAQRLRLDKTVLENMIKKKLKLLEEGENVKLRVKPENLELLQEIKEDLIIKTGYIEEIKVIADEEIKDNGVIIETDFGGLDATVSTQLEKIEDELLEVTKDG